MGRQKLGYLSLMKNFGFIDMNRTVYRCLSASQMFQQFDFLVPKNCDFKALGHLLEDFQKLKSRICQNGST